MAPKTATPAPTNELGAQQWTMGSDSPLLEEFETAAELQQWQAAETYASMLNDAHLEGMYRGVMFPIRGYRWFVNPNGAKPATVERVSKTYNLPIGADGQIDQRRTQRRFIFDEHLADALRAPAYGHYFFEQVYDVRQDGPANVNGGWVAYLRKLAPRPPRSIMEIRPARDGGLDYIRVPPLNPNQQTYGATSLGGVKLPVNRLVAYIWDREGANWRGRSMLRSCYRPWKLKDRVLRVGAVNIARAGGVPYVEAAQDTTPEQMRELQALASAFRVGETAGAALPYGAQLKFARAAGGDGAVDFVKLQNEEMARAWVQMLMVLGQTGSGSRALGETFADRADLVQVAIAGFTRDTFNRHQVEDDVEINEGPDEEFAPLVDFAPAGNPVDALAGALDDAQVAGALPADSQAAATVKGECTSRRRPTPAAPTATAAPRATATGPDRIPDAIKNAGVDFEALQATYVAALARLRRQWGDITAQQVDELVAQIAGGQLTQLTATAAGVELLLAELSEVMADGAAAAQAEAAHQGATLAAPDLEAAAALVEARAVATADLIASALAQSAASRAVSLSGSMAGDELATAVRDHLEGLAGRDRDYELSGAVTHAQNEGRFAVMDQAPDGTRLYSSELNDSNTCGPCDLVDGEEYSSMAELRRDYGAGHYVGCEGGNLCRGTGVAVYPED